MNAPIDLQRLAKVLGLLGSDHSGEVLSAARQAESMRLTAGLTWQQILAPALPAPQAALLSVDAAIRAVCSRPYPLNEWEYGFVDSIRGARYPLSDRQLETLDQIVTKVRRAAGRAAA